MDGIHRRWRLRLRRPYPLTLRWWSLILLVMVVVGTELEVSAEEYTVGGAAGLWDIPSLSNINYTMWALWNTYFVGDSLFFRYRNGEHSVLEVTFKDYQNCRNVRPIAMYDGGDTRVALDKYGPYYFICGTPDHCKQGQKFKIDVSDYARAYHPPSLQTPSSSPSQDTTTLAPSSASQGPHSSSSAPPHAYITCVHHSLVILSFSTLLLSP